MQVAGMAAVEPPADLNPRNIHLLSCLTWPSHHEVGGGGWELVDNSGLSSNRHPHGGGRQVTGSINQSACSVPTLLLLLLLLGASGAGIRRGVFSEGMLLSVEMSEGGPLLMSVRG